MSDILVQSTPDPYINSTPLAVNLTTEQLTTLATIIVDKSANKSIPLTDNETNPDYTAPVVGKGSTESSLNDDLIGILNEITELIVSVAIPLAVVFGVVLIFSIIIALCNLCVKRRRSKQFEVGDRFRFRYGSERRAFLKTRSKPVILEADQKSLSMGGTPRHQVVSQDNYHSRTPKKSTDSRTRTSKDGGDFFAMANVSANNDTSTTRGTGGNRGGDNMTR